MTKELNKESVYRSAKPKEKDYTINDGDGLVMLVKKTGVKTWRFIYRSQGKQNRLGLGNYPATTLQMARLTAVTTRQQLADGIDPSETKKQSKQAAKIDQDNAQRKQDGLPIIGSFAEITGKWLASIKHKTKPITHEKKSSRLDRFALPTLGDLPLAAIKSPDILAIIKPLIDDMKLETAHRVHAEISRIYNYAIAHGLTDYNPAQAVAAQIPTQKVKHRAAIIDPPKVGQLLRDINLYQGTFIVQCAFRLSPLVFQRPGEIRQMEWKDINLESKEWRYFVTKTECDHIVPLSRQAIAILEEIKPLTGKGRYVFPSCRGDSRPMSDNTIRTALKTLGYTSEDMTPHGFRSIASTLLNEQGFSPDAIERQLCHMPRDQVRAAYNRAAYLEERRRMMQVWADYLDSLKNGAQVIPFRKVG